MDGECYNVAHVLDGLIDYHMGTVVSKQPNAATSPELLQNRWCAIFGPPEVFQTEGGVRNMKLWCRGLGASSTSGMKWFLLAPNGDKVKLNDMVRWSKPMIMRTIAAQQVKGLEDLKMVAAACFGAKNRLCNKMGLAPVQAVTGRDVAVPTSLMDQLCSGQLKLAMNASLDQKEALRKAERIRAAAVDSFNWIDSMRSSEGDCIQDPDRRSWR